MSRVRAEDWFALRVAVLAFDELAALAGPPGRSAEAIGRDVQPDVVGPPGSEAEVRARVAALLARPEVDAALWLSSPALHAEVAEWRARPDGARGRKVEGALLRTLARLAWRATPLGWMAGLAVGRVAPEGRGSGGLRLGAVDGAARRARLSVGFLTHLVAGAVEGAGEDVRVRRAPTLHRSGGRVRASAAHPVTGAERFHVVEASDAVDVLLGLDAPVALAELAARVASAAEADPDEALDFCRDAAEIGLVVPEPEVALTSSRPALDAASVLRAAGAPDVAGAVETVTDSLDAETDLTPARARELLAPLPAAAADPQRALAGGLRPALVAGALDPAVVASIGRAVDVMAALSPAREAPALAAFRAALERRYGEEAVPLLEALDPEVGVGFPVGTDAGEPWVARMPWEAPARGAEAAHPHLLRRVVAALAARAHEVVLDQADLAAMAAPIAAPLPAAFSVAARIAALPDGGHQVYVRPPNGPGGARLLARFAVDDPHLAALLAGHLEREAALYPHALLAEVVYFPAADLADLAARPVLRGWEIPLRGGSGAPPDRQIAPDDLLIACDRERLVLSSARLGREVRPRAATPLDPDGCASPVFRFLCHLAGGDGGDGTVRWRARDLEELPFLPRVRAGDAVLALARWRLTPAEVAGLTSRARVTVFRDERGLPRFVALAHDEESLAFDLDNPLLVDALVQALGRQRARGAVLEEVWPPPEQLAVAGPRGRHAHEAIIAFVRVEPPPAPAVVVTRSEAVARRVPPGAAWTYARVRAGAGELDRLLTEVVAPLVRGPVAGRPWFFVRAADPDDELRVRARLPALDLLPALGDALGPWIAAGASRGFALDTYEREVERYGGPAGIELCEEWHWRDSEGVLAAVELLADDGALRAALRWKLLLVTNDLLLDALELPAEARDALAARWRDGLRREQGGGPHLARAVGALHRAERRFFDAWADGDLSSALTPALAGAVAHQLDALRPVSARVAAVSRAGALTRDLPEVAGSLLHMHANRLLRGSPRRQEAVAWDLLARHRRRQARR